MKNENQNNIHTTFDKIIDRSGKEEFLKQNSLTIWLTGLSGSGKTTIATYIEKELQSLGYLTKLLDGDNIRSGINNDLSFSKEDRIENIRRISEISKLFIDGGVITINCFFTHKQN